MPKRFRKLSDTCRTACVAEASRDGSRDVQHSRVTYATGLLNRRRTRIAAGLAERFAERNRSSDRDVQRAKPRPHRNGDSRIGVVVHGFRTTGAFATEHQCIVRAEGKIAMRCWGMRGQQNESAACGTLSGRPRIDKVRKTWVPGEIDVSEIVEGGALQGAIAHIESGRTDDVDGHAETGTESQYGPRVLRDVGLVE